MAAYSFTKSCLLLAAMSLVALPACTSETPSENEDSAPVTEETKSAPEMAPPVAKKEPKEITQQGVTRTDNYAWMKDDNWQEVLRDPSVLRADIREHLEAEVAYYEAMTEHLEPLRQTLFEEMKGRIKEDDSSVPTPDGEWEYFSPFP